MMFRARGTDTSRVMTIDDMLSYRDCFTEALPDFNFDNIMIEAMRANQPAPPPTLVTSENAFRHVDVSSLSDEKQYRRKIQVLLNKLTESNVDILTNEILVPEVLQENNISVVVDLIFDKALDEPFFLTTYIKLITSLAKYESAQEPGLSPSTPNSPNSPTGSGPIAIGEANKSRVRRSLITKSQHIFEAQLSKDNVDSLTEEEVDRLRRQEIANIHFVAALLNNNLLGWRVFNAIAPVLFQTSPINDLHVELGIKLVALCGKRIDEGGPEIKAKGNYHPADSFKFIEGIANVDKPPAGISYRVWFAAKNLVELRANKWQVKVVKVDVPPPQPPAPAAPAKAAPAKESETSKRVKDSQPPEWLTEAMKRDALKIAAKTIASKDEEGDATATAVNYDAILSELTALKQDVLPPICRRAVLFPLIKHFCSSPKEEVRAGLLPLLKRHGITELQHAASWVVADAIYNHELEDAPKFFDRLAVLLVECAPNALVDVFPRAGAFLDSFEKEEDEVAEFQEGFMKAWTAYSTEAKKKSVVLPATDKILDSFARNLSPLTQVVAADLLLNVVDTDALSKWVAVASAGSNEKARNLAEELYLFC